MQMPKSKGSFLKKGGGEFTKEELNQLADLLETKLDEFGVEAKVVSVLPRPPHHTSLHPCELAVVLVGAPEPLRGGLQSNA